MKISEHKGSTEYPQRNALYSIKVHWADNTETWESYSTVERCEALHDYAREINKIHLIPREFFD